MQDRESFEVKLTAYALGELEGAEKAEVEQALEGHPADRKLVEEIRATGGLVAAELAKEPSPGLAPGARARIEDRARQTPAATGSPSGYRWAALAAGIAVLGTLGALYPSLRSSDDPARETPPQAPTEKVAEKVKRSDVALAGYADGHAEELRITDYVPIQEPLGNTPASRPSGTPSPQTVAPSGPDRRGRFAGEPARTLRAAGGGRPAAPAPPADPAPEGEDRSTEDYGRIEDNPFKLVSQDPLSTFSIDVDTASYANIRRFLRGGSLPPKDAVRIEEMLNYFPYGYEPPTGDVPFSTDILVAGCAWEPKHRLVRVGIKGRAIPGDERPASNLVFLIDVSGSMNSPNKLPLLKQALQMLVRELREEDSVAIVVYAGASGLVLPSTSGDHQNEIAGALEKLNAGGSTNGGAGIQLAYSVAAQNFKDGGTNRVILATDGDFNVGVTGEGELVRLIEEKAKSGVFLTVLGFGRGNLKDENLEKLADKGNGNYAYIDTILEAKKVLVQEMGATLVTIAKDVKIQVEFNPARVAAYRLVGYENRILAHQDFSDDTKDAGEIGAGHTVTALYQVVPAGQDAEVPGVDPLKYQETRVKPEAGATDEILTLKLRYKAPDGDTSRLLEFAAKDEELAIGDAPADFKFAAAVAEFGLLLRDSPFKGKSTLEDVLGLATEGKGDDPHGYRSEFLELVKIVEALGGR